MGRPAASRMCSVEQTRIGDTTYYQYDAASRRSARIDGEGRLSYYNYDAAGRMTDRLEPDTGPAYFAYDEAGNRIMMQDGSGVSYWAYDALDRSFRQEGI
jgi:YD repeat-containing protein